MRTIQAKELTNDNFRTYGEFYDIMHPVGNHLGDFYPDHVLAANGGTMPMAFSSYVVKRTEVFRVPKGTLVKIDAGVWHQESFVAGNEEDVHVLIVLPQRTYKRDCVLVPYEEADWVRIETDCKK